MLYMSFQKYWYQTMDSRYDPEVQYALPIDLPFTSVSNNTGEAEAEPSLSSKQPGMW